MLAAIKFKKYIPSAGIFCIIISKFSYWKKSSLVILLIINKSAKVDLYNDVLSLDLAIRPRIKNHR